MRFSAPDIPSYLRNILRRYEGMQRRRYVETKVCRHICKNKRNIHQLIIVNYICSVFVSPLLSIYCIHNACKLSYDIILNISLRNKLILVYLRMQTTRAIKNLSRGRTDRQGHGRVTAMRGSVPRWISIAYDRCERSADGAYYAADAEVRELCASSKLSD